MAKTPATKLDKEESRQLANIHEAYQDEAAEGKYKRVAVTDELDSTLVNIHEAYQDGC